MRTISTVVGVFALVITCIAGELATSYKQAAELGDLQEKAPATAGYFTGTLLPYYEQKYGPVLQSCFGSTPQPDSNSFSFVVAIGSNGRALRLYADRETNIYRCLSKEMRADEFPKPPVFPYYLHIDMQLQGDVNGADSQSATTENNITSPPNEKAGTDDFQQWVKSCRIVGMTLAARERMRESGDVPGNDDFTAAGRACDRLTAAIATSDPSKIERAKQDLRSIFARLGVPPLSPQEQFAALEKKSADLSGADLFDELPDLAKRAPQS